MAKRSKPTKKKLAGESVDVLLEAVRDVVRKWNAELAERTATGADASRMLYDVSEAAWPKHK